MRIRYFAWLKHRVGLAEETLQLPAEIATVAALKTFLAQRHPGFAEALTLMPKGATYRFWIPPQLGYGPNDNGPIPGNSVLVFDLTLEDIQQITPEMIQRMQMMQQMQQQQAQQSGQ